MTENTDKPENSTQIKVKDQGNPLDIRDLVTDESDPLAEYLSVSISNDGQDTTISATSSGADPQVTQTVISGVIANDLQDLIQGIEPNVPDTDVI
jgi:hypothetical protein